MLINEVFNEDNMVGMARYLDKFFDLALADPPYFAGAGKMGFYGKKSSSIGVKCGNFSAPMWDDYLPTQEWYNELRRISKDQIIWGANYYPFIGPVHKTPRRQELDLWVTDHPVGWIVWDKMNGETDFNDFELAWTSFDRPTIVFPLLWNGMIQAKSLKESTVMQGNKRLNERRIHPTQKPVLLSIWLLQQYCGPAQNLIVTHMGSQGDRIAAAKLGINYRGWEIDPVHYSAGNKRFREQTAQLSLL